MSNCCCICIDDIHDIHDINDINDIDNIEPNDLSQQTSNSEVYNSLDLDIYFMSCCNNKIHKKCLLDWVIYKGSLICPLCRDNPSCITTDDLFSYKGNINYDNLNKLINELVGDDFEIKIISNNNHEYDDIIEMERQYNLDRNDLNKFYINIVVYILVMLCLIYLVLQYNNNQHGYANTYDGYTNTYYD